MYDMVVGLVRLGGFVSFVVPAETLFLHLPMMYVSHFLATKLSVLALASLIDRHIALQPDGLQLLTQG